MLFSSLTFLFIFLPVVLFLYFISKDKYKNLILFFSSLIFYAWGEPKYILLMVISILINYIMALIISKNKDKKLISKIVLITTLFINVGILFFFKYFNFFADIINHMIDSNIEVLDIIMPIGISFYTFQMLSYIIDVYRGKIEVQKNIITLGTYIALFPQLIAGPIVRYETIEKELKNRKHSLEKVADGSRRFAIGLAKKVIIANNVAFIADQILNSSHINEYNSLVIWIAMISYTLQIYYDFSGYSDMAIGLGKIFGFTFLENFNYPYISKSATEFWRRWHISLSSWFRDYVYIPLGGNRVPKWRWILNILIVWSLTGLWHGANWNFIAWGLYFGVILLIEKLLLSKFSNKVPSFFKWIYAMIIIIVGWTIFRIEDFDLFLIIIRKMFTFCNKNFIMFVRSNYELLNYLIYFIVAIFGAFPFFGNKLSKMLNCDGIKRIIANMYIILIFIISIFFLIKSTYNPFIYFRF